MKNRYAAGRNSLPEVNPAAGSIWRSMKGIVFMSFFICMLIAAGNVRAQVEVQITNGGSSSNSAVTGPIYQSGVSSGTNAKHIYLFTQDELAAAGIFPGVTIRELAWYKADTGVLINNAQARLIIFQRSGVSLTEYNTGVHVLDYADTSAASGNGWQYLNTVTYDANTNNLPKEVNWMRVPVSPFVYTGGGLEIYVQNMLIQDAGNLTNKALSFRRQYGSNTTLYSTTANPTATTTFSRMAYRPDILITYTRPANNVLVAAVTEPVSFCAGIYDIKVDLQNNGSNIIDSVQIHWTMNGVMQPVINRTTPVDTIGAPGGNSATVTLRSNVNIPANTPVVIKAWPVLPNGVSVPVKPTDTLNATIRPGLSGSYTVGGAGADFDNFTDAVSTLNAYGVCGPVVMNIRPGTYDGQAVLGPVNGVDATNTITFRSETRDPDDVTITHAQTGTGDNYVIRLSNISNVFFRQLTFRATGTTSLYTTVMELADTVSYVTVDSCKLIGNTSSTSSSMSGSLLAARSGTPTLGNNFTGGNISFTNNLFQGGGVGVYFYGSSAARVDGVFDNNIFDGQGSYGAYFYYASNIKFRNNIVTLSTASSTSSQYGVYCYYCYEGTEVTGNRIEVAGGTASNPAPYGMYFYYNYGNAIQRSVIANNAVSVGGGATATCYALYSRYGAYQHIYNNSFNITGGSPTNAYAGYFYYSGSTYSGSEILNNIFANSGGGGAMYVYNTGANAFDYNNLYTSGTVLVNKGNSTALQAATLADWRAADGQDLHSISYRPAFTSSTDLRPDPADSAAWALNGRGVHIPGNTADIEGSPRSVTPAAGVPDLGAYEFTPVSVPPLAVATPDTIAAGTTQVFTFGGDTVAGITWNGTTVPGNVQVRQYSGTIPPAYTGTDSMFFYTDIQAAGGPYDYDLHIYYKDPWIGTLKAEPGILLTEKSGSNPWVSYPGSGSSLDTSRNIISRASLTSLGLYTGTGETCSGRPVAPVIATPAITTPQCPGSAYTLVAEDRDVTSGITYQWQQAPSGAGPWTSLSGATTLTYQTPALPAQIYYRIKATCANSGDSAFSAAYEIPILPSAQLLSWQDGSRCGSGTVTLSAAGSAGATVYWYDQPSGGLLLDTGNTYTTPVLTSDDTFYVSASATTRDERVPSAPVVLDYISISKGAGLGFVVNNMVTINTVDLYPRNSSSGSAWVQILITTPDLSDTVFTGPVYNFTSATTPELHTVPVNATLSPGAYRMIMQYSGISGIVRTLVSSVGGNNLPYPYVSPSGSVSIIQAHGGTTNTNTVAYNFFYNWSVSIPCESPRQAVKATLGAAPAFAASATQVICNDAVATLTVTSPPANYDSVTWAPVAGLYTNAAGTVPYTGGHAATVYARTDTARLRTFVASAYNTATACGNVDTVHTFVQPAWATATANPPDICLNGSTTLRLDHAADIGPGSIQWQSSANGTSFTDIPGASLPVYTTGMLNTTTYYRAVIRNSAGATCVEVPLTVTVSRSEVISTNSVIHCGADSVVLSATGSPGSVLKWYDAISGGRMLDTGTNFITPFLGTTTTFYVVAEGGKRSGYIGKQDRSIPGVKDSGSLIFDAYLPFTLESVSVYPVGTGSGTVTIALRSAAGAVLDSAIVTLTGTAAPGIKTVVPLNFSVPVGGNLRLTLKRRSGNITGLIRESVPAASAAVSYPYTIPGMASITGSNGEFTSNKLYQFFYDWRISVPCESPRTPVTATITPAPAFTATASPAAICLGDTATLSGASANTGYAYQWMPGNLTGSSVAVSPAATTKYYVTALDNSGGPNDGCVGYDSVTVAVNPLPDAVITPAGSTTICEGDSVSLFASTGVGYSYQWQRNGTPISGAMGSVYAAREEGGYTVAVTDGQSCMATSAPEAVTVLPAPQPGISVDGAGLTTGSFSSYQWYRNGTLIPGATGQRYTPTDEGEYTVVVTGPDNCPGESAPFHWYPTGVGTVSGVRAAVHIYPNPASTTVHIDAPVPVQVTVSSAEGKVVLQQVNVKDIDISRLADAVYMIRVTDMDGTLLQIARLVKTAR